MLFLWMIKLGKQRKVVIFPALILVFIYIPVSKGEKYTFSAALTKKITKHVLFLSFSWSKIVSPNCSASGSKTELTSKMSVLINREQKDQN